MKIAVFDAVGTYFSAPTLRCMLEEFDRAGCEVDVYLRLGGGRLGEISRAQARPFPVPLRAWCGDWENTLRQWKWYLKYRGCTGRRALDSRRYDLAIGLNPEGVVAAHRYWKRTGTPFVYLSFELFFRDELRQEGLRRFKEEEVAASRDAAMVITQDEWRAGLLSAENKVPLEKMAFLPVAPRGSDLPSRTDYLREKLGISASQTVVLHAGSFTHFTCAHEIMDTLPQWPEGFVLVVNTPYSAHADDPFLKRLQEVGGSRVRLTSGNKSAEEYGELVRSADIGLALYQPDQAAGGGINDIFSGRNIQTMGLSSGKLAMFACNGVPLVCGGNPALKELLRPCRFGEYADAVGQLPGCLARIRARRSEYACEARRFFEESLDFNRFWPEIWRQMIEKTSGQND